MIIIIIGIVLLIMMIITIIVACNINNSYFPLKSVTRGRSEPYLGQYLNRGSKQRKKTIGIVHLQREFDYINAFSLGNNCAVRWLHSVPWLYQNMLSVETGSHVVDRQPPTGPNK